VLAFADVVQLLPDELAGRRGRTLTLFEVTFAWSSVLFSVMDPSWAYPLGGTDSRK
jgi:hypothetical protein